MESELERAQRAIRVAMTVLDRRLKEHDNLTGDVRATWRADEYAMRDVYRILKDGLKRE